MIQEIYERYDPRTDHQPAGLDRSPKMSRLHSLEPPLRHLHLLPEVPAPTRPGETLVKAIFLVKTSGGLVT